MNDPTYYELFLLPIIGFIVAGGIWLFAAFIAWGEGKRFCYHDLEYVGGGMGDAVRCKKCELNTYDGFNSHLWIYRLLGRVKDIR